MSEDLTTRARLDAAALRRALRLYAVTDRAWLGAKSGDEAIRALETQIEAALRGGATVVQLREKNLSGDEFRREAVAVKRLCERFGVPLIIDDALDVALECDADGLHVGQRDLEAGARAESNSRRLGANGCRRSACGRTRRGLSRRRRGFSDVDEDGRGRRFARNVASDLRRGFRSGRRDRRDWRGAGRAVGRNRNRRRRGRFGDFRERRRRVGDAGTRRIDSDF